MVSFESGRPSKRFEVWKRPKITHGKLTEYNWVVLYPDGLELADFVDIGSFTILDARSGIVIEKDVQIGSHCAIYSESTIDGKKGKIVLKENCRLGSHCTVMPGVTIGKNTVIGAHSFVNRSIGENEVWAGVPARLIRKLI
jgi:acetyltransferase-like isoleucine patch superfamily enzyme